jgi:hypothetical protein
MASDELSAGDILSSEYYLHGSAENSGMIASRKKRAKEALHNTFQKTCVLHRRWQDANRCRG